MKIETALLKPIVQSAARLSAKRTSLPILNHLLLDGSNGCLNVSATDLDVFVSASVEKKDGKLPRLCVPSRQFSALVASAGDTLDLQVAANGRLRMESGWVREFVTLPATDFVAEPDVKGMKPVAVALPDLAEAIEAVAWSADPNVEQASKFWRNSLLMEISAKRLKVSAGNGPQFAFFSRALIGGEARFCVPVKAAYMLGEALKGNEAKLLLNEKRLTVTHAGGMFSTVLAEDTWPNYKAVIEQESVGLGSCQAETLKASLLRASAGNSEQETAPINVTVEVGKWLLSADSDTGPFSETFEPSKKNTAKRNFSTNARWLIQGLGQLPADAIVDFSMAPEELNAGGIFMEWKDCKFVAMKMRIK